VADGRGDGQFERLLLECAPGGGSSDASAAAGRGVPGDRLRALAGASGIQVGDRGCHLGLQLEVLARSSYGIAFATTGARRLVGEALGFRLLERRLLNQDALALVAAAGTTEPHNHRRQPAAAPCTPGQRGVA